MKRLIAFISILMLVSVAAGTTITIYGTNKSNADANITCYGCNNTIEVQAWNTSYVKNFTVYNANESVSIDFNISNVTGYQVQELKVNGTAVNGYQAGANGMLNFSYTIPKQTNRTFVLSPAVNDNGRNMTWVKIWNSIPFTSVRVGGHVTNTVYQNRNMTICDVRITGVTATTINVYSDTNNPPTTLIAQVSTSSNQEQFGFNVLPGHYYYTDAGMTTLTLWTEWC